MTINSQQKSIVLLSGGLDSAVALKESVDVGDVVLAITFDYGQRAAKREVDAARSMAERFDVRHEVVELPWLKSITTTSLVDRGKLLPRLSPGELDGAGGKTDWSARAVWVPNRNGLFINIAASYCEAIGAEIIVAGFNAEEAATFPDNSPEFINAVNLSLSYSTLSKAKVTSPTSRLDKAGIVRLGLEIGAPLDLLWSCYEEGERMCGECESCLRLKRGIEEAGADLLTSLFR